MIARRFLLASALIWSGLAAPALADSPEQRDPGLAAGMSLIPPAVLIGSGLLLPQIAPLAIASPLAFGSGYVYAGDPWRGAGVAAGGLAVPLAAAGLVGAATLMTPRPDQAFAGGMWMNLAAAAAAAGYGAWVYHDVTETTRRLNEARAAE
ncbi:MAG: hypothetical protein ACLGIN_13480 [Candidatus Sericytochromatia bacterium]